MVKLNDIYKKDGRNINVKRIQENLSKFDTETDIMLDNGIWYSDENDIDTNQEQGIF